MFPKNIFLWCFQDLEMFLTSFYAFKYVLKIIFIYNVLFLIILYIYIIILKINKNN